jgi:hypothetical protein
METSFIFSIILKKWKEYDVKTKKFIRYTFGPNHSLLFKNLNTGMLLDNFKIPGTLNQSFYVASSDGWECVLILFSINI